MARDGKKYAPFETATMQSYRVMLSALATGEATVPEVSNVQAALGALQDKSLIWKEKRGVYFLEESTTADLMRQHGPLEVVGSRAPRPR